MCLHRDKPLLSESQYRRSFSPWLEGKRRSFTKLREVLCYESLVVVVYFEIVPLTH